MTNPPALIQLCAVCQTPKVCRIDGRCMESNSVRVQNEQARFVADARQSDGKTPVWADGVKPPAEWIEREKQRRDFAGYMMVGGPHDGDMLRFQSSGGRIVAHLDRTPRPGAELQSSSARVAFDEYAAEHLVGFRFYRHRSLDLRQAVNRLLLWYLPPAPADVEQARAVLLGKESLS